MVKISRIRYEREREIIAQELRVNPSASVNDIANKYGFSKQKIYKIKRELKISSKHSSSMMFSDDTLRYFIILAKTDKNLNLLDDNIQSKMDLRPARKKMEKMGVNLEFSYLANGDSDVVLGISSKDISCAKMFCTLVKQDLSTVIKNIEMIEILKQFDINNALYFNTNDTNRTTHT